MAPHIATAVSARWLLLIAGLVLAGAWLLIGYRSDASLVAGDVVPFNLDSFYHASRVLDAMPDLGAFREFDPRIHAPEGSWATWPWAYDYALAAIANLQRALAPAWPPLTLLALLVPLMLALALYVLARSVMHAGLSLPAGALVLILYALYPQAQFAFSVGNLDHHWAEAICALLALRYSLAWTAQPGRVDLAIALGVVLGACAGIHNGLFLLQVPVGLMLLGLWWSGSMPPLRACMAFALGLVGATLLLLLPSEPFRGGQYQFYLLSWFHLHLALLSACWALLLARFPRGSGAFGLVAMGLLLLAALPAAMNLSLALNFVSADIPFMANLAETRGVLAHFRSGGWREVLHKYSVFPLLVPVLLAGLWYAHRRAALVAIALGCHLLIGLALYLSQDRLWYFGLPSLLLALGLALDALLDRLRAAPGARAVACLALAVLLLWPFAGGMLVRYRVGGEYFYEMLRPMLQRAAHRCAGAPAVWLSDPEFGHYVNYHTDCATIADNFGLTAQHIGQIVRARALMSGTPQAVASADEHVRFVLVEAPDAALRAFYTGEALDPAAELRPLYRNQFERIPQLPGFTLLDQIVLQRPDGAMLALFRLYAVTSAQ